MAGSASTIARRTLSSSWFLGAVVAFAAARSWAPFPTVGLDPSWQAALHMAARWDVEFGGSNGITFTYGPLGFLALGTLYYASTAVLAFLFSSLSQVVVAASLLHASRCTLGLPLALLLTYVAARFLRLVDLPEVLPVVVLIGCLEVVRRGEDHRLTPMVPIAGGLASSFMLLVKFNSGLLTLALCVLAVSFSSGRRLRTVGTLLMTLLVSLASFWLITGNGAGDLPAWVSASADIASGYSTAMGVEPASRATDYWWLLLAVAALLVAMSGRPQQQQASRRVATSLVVAVFVFAAFKRGFVRHDEHAYGFFALLPAAVLAVGVERRRMLPAFAVVLVAVVAITPYSSGELFDPLPTARAAVSSAVTLGSAERRSAHMAAAREAQRAAYGVDETVLAGVAGRTVHVDPWEASLLWAYPELEWRPLPVFQSYSAYTADLDDVNASALRSSEGPERILRETPRAIDTRNPDFESPAAVQAMLCGYRQISAGARWQVLGRARWRCGTPERIATTVARVGERVVVPAAEGPPAFVFARIEGIDRSLTFHALALVFKVPETAMATDDGSVFRLVPETARHPLLMSAPPELGYSPQFGFSRQIRSFRLLRSNGVALVGAGKVTVSFFRVPLVR